MEFLRKNMKLIDINRYSKEGKETVFVKVGEPDLCENIRVALDKNINADELILYKHYDVYLNYLDHWKSVRLIPSESKTNQSAIRSN